MHPYFFISHYTNHLLASTTQDVVHIAASTFKIISTVVVFVCWVIMSVARKRLKNNTNQQTDDVDSLEAMDMAKANEKMHPLLAEYETLKAMLFDQLITLDKESEQMLDSIFSHYDSLLMEAERKMGYLITQTFVPEKEAFFNHCSKFIEDVRNTIYLYRVKYERIASSGKLDGSKAEKNENRLKEQFFQAKDKIIIKNVKKVMTSYYRMTQSIEEELQPNYEVKNLG